MDDCAKKESVEPGMVAHTRNPSYFRGRGWRMVVGAPPPHGKSWRLYLKNKLKAKGLGAWLKW
jgi:hypothetical protein